MSEDCAVDILFRAYDPGGGLRLQPCDHGKKALSRQLVQGSLRNSSAPSPVPRVGVRVHDVHSITSAYDRQDSRSPVRCARSPSRHYTDDLNMSTAVIVPVGTVAVIAN